MTALLATQGPQVDGQPMTQSPAVYVILLNYRGIAETLECLESLKGLAYPNHHLVVVDNASGDGSLETLRATLTREQTFHLIESDANLGFSGGNNLGIRYALEQGADYIWLLNNDTTVEADSLSALVAESQKTGGLAGSVLYYPDGTYQRVGTRLNWSTGGVRGIQEASLSTGMAVENLTGASMLLPRKVLEAVGLLDESYFLYFEDGEYTLRALRAGYPATVTVQSRIFHKEGASTGRHSLRTQYYYHRNRLKMFSRYAGWVQCQSIYLYTGYRLFRSLLKGWMSSSQEKKDSARVHWLAVSDFMKGVDGPCPHSL